MVRGWHRRHERISSNRSPPDQGAPPPAPVWPPAKRSWMPTAVRSNSMTASGRARGSSSPSRPTAARILLIEDDPSLLATLVVSLEARHFTVRSAAKGADGLQQASLDEPDLVILDL